MGRKILLILVILICGFLGYVTSRPGHFSYSRGGVINAPAEKIFPYLNMFTLGKQWSPYEKDPTMKESIMGPDGQVGTKMIFESKNSGDGELQITKVVPNQTVEMTLTMTSPFRAENVVVYSLNTVPGGTQFTWTMSGEGGFMGKLMSTVIDCEKMIGKQFEEGVANLKTVVESAQPVTIQATDSKVPEEKQKSVH